MTDIYANEDATQELLRKDTRTPAERKLDRMLEERGASEQGAEPALILRQIALGLLAEQPAQQRSMSDMKFGGCPFCGSQSCVAGQCQRPAQQEPVARILSHQEMADAAKRYTSPQPAQQEPVATLWQHGETGRTRITMPGDITDCDARWFKAADLFTFPPAQRKPLTDDEIESCLPETIYSDADGWIRTTAQTFHDFARAIEAAHGIKENT